METQTIIKKLRIIFYVCTAIMCVCAAVSHFAMPNVSDTLGDSTKYILQLACSLLPMFVAIVAYTQAPVFVAKAKKEQRAQAYKRWSIVTMLLFTCTIIMNILVKYALDYDSAYYCAAICVVMFVLSYPRQSKLTEATNKQ